MTVRRELRVDHCQLLDRLGNAMAIYERWPSESNRKLADAAHLDVLDSSLRYSSAVVRVVPWR